MKNIATNALNYTGIVTFYQRIGTKKIKVAQFHNTGGTSLFNFLSNCLAGDFAIAKLNRPTKVKLLRRYENATGTYSYESVTQFIFLRTPPAPTFNAGESRVRFSFIIPRDFLDKLTSYDGVLGLGLYANSVLEGDTENFMAFCALDELDQSALVNVFLDVDWELVISNSPSDR